MPKNATTRFVLAIGFALIALAAVFTGVYFYKTRMQSESAGALIGGPFEMVDHNGKTVTEQDFLGKYMLIYFGYTYCPDVCPTSLTIMTQALDMVEERSPETVAKITPVFITVDPERDTVPAIKDYVSNFYPGMVGLTGSLEQVKNTAKAYRVFYRKAESEEANDYFMDHSSITYLMGPDGQYVKHFGHGATPEQIAKGLLEKVE